MPTIDLGKVTGEQGPKGDTGAQGPTGLTGPQGPEGPANESLEIETSLDLPDGQFLGQLLHILDVDEWYLWDGSAWREMAPMPDIAAEINATELTDAIADDDRIAGTDISEEGALKWFAPSKLLAWLRTKNVALTSEIPTTLPASDVSAWAKASTKPAYTAAEVGAASQSANLSDLANKATAVANLKTAIEGSPAFNFSNRPQTGGSNLLIQADTDARMVLNIMRGVYRWSNTVSNYTHAPVSGGSSTTYLDTISLKASATAGSVALIYSNIFNFRVWHNALGGTRGVVNWSLRTSYSLRLFVQDLTGADTVARFLLGHPITTATSVDFDNTDRGIGFKIVGLLLYVHVANGTSATLISTGVTLTGLREYDLCIDCDGAGNWAAYVNGSSVATGSGAPTGNSGAAQNNYIMSVTNGTTAAIRECYIVSHSTIQL